MSRAPGGRRARAALRSRTAVLVAAAVLSAALAFTADLLGGLASAERTTVDARFQLRGEDRDRIGPVPIAVVGMDTKSLGEIDEYPLPRRWHARVIDRLVAAGARVVAYDVQFTEPSPSARDDEALLDAVDAAPRIVLAATETDRDGATAVLGGPSMQRDLGVRVGHTGVDRDDDGVVRRFRTARDGLVAFPVVAAELATGRRATAADGSGRWVDLVGPSGSFPRYSLVDVAKGRVPAARLRGRIVVVGATAPSLGDIHATATDAAMPGPELLANAIATTLRGDPIRDAGGAWNVLLTLLAALAAPLVARRRGPVSTVLAAAAAALLLGVVAYGAFLADRVVDVATPALALGLGTLTALAISTAFEAAGRQRTREVFARFVAADVVDDVLAETGRDVRLGGMRTDASVLFCDLRGSTALLERLDPEEGIAVLNRFLAAMSDAVDHHGGTMVGFRGDGLMAVFGAPLAQEDHADRALAAAREMTGPALRGVLAELAADGLETDLRMGVGIASGLVMVGNVGSQRRMEYTAIGDPANVAARLEGMTKDHPHPILLSDATQARLARRDGLTSLGALAVRGRSGTIVAWGADPGP
ncbi:adenylate/guanylate cyclase domain-containing protein [Patulibacter brassicae]|uniref:Adenylate/guanylate cyclase domain-containing protein n=1 Tax=Patulibacter brassicae TaxID=1705717 RepID=A0ABU4VPY1_9ACTN|nr:adenylate/guanylate cyclase domain-containing protein [Patulibacter brassicae]MDX8153689.1 adenylate/guanylate cyclase domain-containing protein [Patulibacter brassicae]